MLKEQKDGFLGIWKIMKNMVKILVIFIIVISCCIVIPQNQVNAAERTVSGIVKGMKAVEPTEGKYSDLAGVVGKILSFLQIAAGITTVIVVAFLGFELMTDTPADTKEAVKKKLFPVLIGIILVFGATSIASFIISVNGGTSSSTTYDRTQVVENGE